MKNSPKFYHPKQYEGKQQAMHFINAIIIDPETGYEGKGELLVEDGIIKEFSKTKITKLAKNCQKIDCGGKIIAPALVDAQVHTGEPGGNYKEKIEDTSRAAVAGGVGTIALMPNTEPCVDSTSMVEFIKNRAAEKSYCDVAIFAAATSNMEGKNLTEMGLLKKAGVKGFTDANNYIQDTLVFKRVCEYARNFNMLVAQTPLDSYLSSNGIINEGEISARLGVAGINSVAEKIALQRDLAIADITNVRYHAYNVSTEDSVEILKNNKNKNISSSTSVNHISLTEDEALNYRTFAKIQPPLKTNKDRKAVIKALRDGVIDFIASKHAAKSEDQKRHPLSSAEFGAVGLETFFAATYTILSQNRFKLADIFRLVSLNPAKFLGFKNKGAIKKGNVADLIVIDINNEYVLTRDMLSGKGVNTPFDGKNLKGKIIQTYISGRLVYENE
ncbi:MAG TPA: dihydroorotase [Alphaproteobacteria bacterium]|nr:dihydroorotase [Alphaproteobacteria bacterium]